ncbi:MAG: EamA family transporter, partial [Candidatus Zixiibacteriota bacterium]
MTPGSSQRISFGAVLTAIVIIQLGGSLAYPVAKVGLAIIEPFTFAFYRYLLASILLMTLVRFQRQSRPIARGDIPRILLLGFLIIPLNQTLFLWGQSKTAAGHGAVLFATTPVFIFILAITHLKERPGIRRILGIALAISGSLTIMLGGAVEVGKQYLVGDLLLLGSVLAWSYYTIVGKTMVQKYGALRITAYALTSGSVMYFPFGLYRAMHFDYSLATPAAWGSIAYMAIGLSFVVYVLWYWLLKHL